MEIMREHSMKQPWNTQMNYAHSMVTSTSSSNRTILQEDNKMIQ